MGIVTYRDFDDGTRFGIVSRGATATSGFLLKPREGQVIVIERYVISGFAAGNATTTRCHNVRLCTVDSAGSPSPAGPGVFALTPMHRMMPKHATIGQAINIHQNFDNDDEIRVGEGLGVGWFVETRTLGGRVYVAFDNLTLSIVGRFEGANARSGTANYQFQPQTVT